MCVYIYIYIYMVQSWSPSYGMLSRMYHIRRQCRGWSPRPLLHPLRAWSRRKAHLATVVSIPSTAVLITWVFGVLEMCLALMQTLAFRDH